MYCEPYKWLEEFIEDDVIELFLSHGESLSGKKLMLLERGQADRNS